MSSGPLSSKIWVSRKWGTMPGTVVLSLNISSKTAARALQTCYFHWQTWWRGPRLCKELALSRIASQHGRNQADPGRIPAASLRGQHVLCLPGCSPSITSSHEASAGPHASGSQPWLHIAITGQLKTSQCILGPLELSLTDPDWQHYSGTLPGLWPQKDL